MGKQLGGANPEALCGGGGPEQQSEVDVALVDGALVITPSHGLTLDELLDRVTDDNLHSEIDSGSPVGHEVW